MPRHRIESVLTGLLIASLLSSALLVGACSGSGTSALERTGAGKPASSAGKPVKELKDYNVQLLNASTIKLSEMVGRNKVIVLDFWATWCGPCRQEIPHLVELQRKYQSQGVEVIGLSIENPKIDTEKVNQFAKDFAINYRLGFSTQEMFADFNGDDPRMAIPQTFIFGRDGTLVKAIRGMNPVSIRAMLQDAIEKALQTGKA